MSRETWKSDAIWAGMTAAVLSYEIFTLRTNRLDHTLTRTVRRTFRTAHPYGRAVFAIAWGSFSIWLTRHILEASDPIDAVLEALKGKTDEP